MKLSAFLILIPAALHASAQLLVQHDGPIFDPTMGKAEGFSLDLSDRRIIEFEDGSKVVVTEGEKLDLKVNGERFFDM